jgi:hypothetical protein
MHVFNIQHVMLVDEAEFRKDYLNFGSPLSVESAINGLEFRIGKYCSFLPLLVLNGSE